MFNFSVGDKIVTARGESGVVEAYNLGKTGVNLVVKLDRHSHSTTLPADNVKKKTTA